MNIPNSCTFLRIILIPVLVVFFYIPWHWGHFCSAVIFALAGVTDWLDGYLARSLKQMSALGQFLDPVADKLIVAVSLVLLTGQQQHLVYFAIPAAIIVGREIGVSALREWMAELGKSTSVAVSFIGKLKTSLQMVAVTGLLATSDKFLPEVNLAGYWLLWVAAVLTVWSMCIYLQAAYRELHT
jgi:CDP-diacylglycerol--glycerol-3-phosphate 3-phosphatidyltransferase